MAAALEFVLNGRPVPLEGVSPNTTLLEFLRARGLTGTKEGCAEGDCGACSVAIVESDANGKPTYRAVNSCLMPICLLAGREVVSVEGVGCQGAHPVQRAMTEGFGSQCGYCTPGFICSLFEGYYREDLRTEDDLDEQLSGNLCRCTGYRPIHDAAVEAFSGRRRDDASQSKTNGEDIFQKRLENPALPLACAHYQVAGETFFRPTSLAELLRLKSENPEARLIAGATELGLEITKRFKKFPVLISTEAVSELKALEATDNEWRIGAAVTLTEIKDRLGKEFPALNDMLRVFGSRQIRNRATMGGNIVTASPIGDSAPVLLALDAKIVIVGQASSLSPSKLRPENMETGWKPVLRERTLPIGDFFVSYRKTALQPDEILKTIIIPRGGPKAGLTRRCEWFKVSKRREMDISTVAGCFTVDVDAQNIVRHMGLAFGGVAAMPVRALKTEAALLG
ncbi:MAG TPA: FAD binding domain-containing protein, partial [Verrucomicrobiae bacterium]|nr:FAD binding domain-containing protein [Verrucomicrobiae bacterium]